MDDELELPNQQRKPTQGLGGDLLRVQEELGGSSLTEKVNTNSMDIKTSTWELP